MRRAVLSSQLKSISIMTTDPNQIRTLGIDASLNGTGLCLFTGDSKGYSLAQTELIMTKDKGVTRLRSLRSLLRRWLIEHDVSGATTQVALIEGYAYGASGRIANLGEWGGILRVELADRDIALAEMHNAHLKQFVTGKGNSQKNEMLLHIYQRYQQSFSSDDAGDAFALATAAQASVLEARAPELISTRWKAYFDRAISAQERSAAGKVEQIWQPSALIRAKPRRR